MTPHYLPLSGQSNQEPFAPSLDRVEIAKGYTPDNTRVVCMVFNFARNTWGDAPVLQMAAALRFAVGQTIDPPA